MHKKVPFPIWAITGGTSLEPTTCCHHLMAARAHLLQEGGDRHDGMT